jgi:hypothetical protein
MATETDRPRFLGRHGYGHDGYVSAPRDGAGHIIAVDHLEAVSESEQVEISRAARKREIDRKAEAERELGRRLERIEDELHRAHSFAAEHHLLHHERRARWSDLSRALRRLRAV